MRSALIVVVAAILAMLLQATILPALVPVPILPDLILVLVVYLGLRHHGAGGVAGAFLLGYFIDTFSGTVPGLNAFAMTAAYVAVYLVSRTLWMEGGLPAMVVVFVASCVRTAAAVTITTLVEAGTPVWEHAVRYGLAEAGLAALVTPLVLGFLGWEKRLVGLAS